MSNEPKDTTAADKKPPKRASYKLKQPIIQGTEPKAPPETVDLTEAQAKRLREQGVVE